MMKKRNVAVAMAAVTVASTAAPLVAQAAEISTDVKQETVIAKNSAKLISEVRELLKVKYSDTEECVYSITVGGEEIVNATDLSKKINELQEGESLVVTIVDKGHATIEDKVVNKIVPKYTVKEVTAIDESANEDVIEKVEVSSDAVATVTLKESKRELKFKTGDDKVKFDNPVDANGEKVVLPEEPEAVTKPEVVEEPNPEDEKYQTGESGTGEDHPDYKAAKAKYDKYLEEKKKYDEYVTAKATYDSNLAKALKKIVGFEKADKEFVYGVDSSTSKANTKKLAEVTVTNSDSMKVTADSLYDGLRLTEDGKALLDAIGKTFEEGNKKFKLVAEATDVKEIEKDKLYSTTIKLGKVDVNIKSTVAMPFMNINIESRNKEDLQELVNIINAGESQINVIAGTTRYTTAIEVSKELEKANELSNNAVVLVNSGALVDGLAATPLATAVEAPILLTEKTSVNTDTMNEIKEVLKFADMSPNEMKDKTIYLVGGESVISSEVEKQLEVLGAKIERISGDNRHETSVAVAETMSRLQGLTIDKAFVVGATGEADAMSIAGYAAKNTAPIIVNGFSEISKDATTFLKGKQIDIIGGNTAVNESTEEQLKELDKDKKITRVEGSNRFETNANVINKYYTNSLTDVIVSKDGQKEGNDKLVDALAAGPLAASKNAPIVLATNDLSVEQDEILELRLLNSARVHQVGGGVELNVIQKIAKKLGLK